MQHFDIKNVEMKCLASGRMPTKYRMQNYAIRAFIWKIAKMYSVEECLPLGGTGYE